ncbi:MAG: hypothetical protein AAGM27_00810 [Cyanobacteria bacterium J06554_3]
MGRPRGPEQRRHGHDEVLEDLGQAELLELLEERLGHLGVLDLEAQAEVTSELNGGTLERKFSQLEQQSNVNEQLAQMKAKLLSSDNS